MILDERIEQADEVELLSIIGKATAALQARALARLTSPTLTSITTEPEADRLLKAEEAAPLVGLDVKALKRRRDLPFRRVIGGRTVRYSSKAIARYLRTRAA